MKLHLEIEIGRDEINTVGELVSAENARVDADRDSWRGQILSLIPVVVNAFNQRHGDEAFIADVLRGVPGRVPGVDTEQEAGDTESHE